ncbi:MAG: sugar phosphate isomerase/epimerase family protein, partial [Vicinamibacteraceae bacterium]
GFGAATLALVRSGQAAPTGMSISLNGSLAPGVQWPELARLAARVGYAAVDVSLDDAREAGLDATRALFAELKIVPAIVNLPFRLTGPEEDFDDGLKELSEVAQFLTSIDCPRMMAVLSPASRTPKAEQRKIVQDRLTAISESLAPSKIRVGLEFLGPMYMRTRLPHEFIWRMDETLELAKDSGANIGLVLDAWHWHHAGASVADILAAGKSRIVHVHVSDAKQQPPEAVRDNQRLMPGEGVIDLMAFFQALAKIGYTDAVSPEPLGRVPEGMSAEEGARLGLETTTAVMRKAGVI